VTVVFYGSVIDRADGQDFVQLRNSVSVRTLIDELGRRFGPNFKTFLLGDETCLFLVNGRGILATGGLDTALAPGDKIEVLPFIEAG